MALQTPMVTRANVTEPQHDLYKITFMMVADDDTPGFPGLDESYTINYKRGNDVGLKVAEVIKVFQEKIDRYQRAATVAVSVPLATAVSSIQNGLVV